MPHVNVRVAVVIIIVITVLMHARIPSVSWYSPISGRQSLASSSKLLVKFQPTSASTPRGYIADTGIEYGKRSVGLSYGWNSFHGLYTRDRKKTGDAITDTLIHVIPFKSVWEIALPNDDYFVRVLYGDPEFAGVYTVTVEDKIFVDNHRLGPGPAVWVSSFVTVSDGRLTLTANGRDKPADGFCAIHKPLTLEGASRINAIEIQLKRNKVNAQEELLLVTQLAESMDHRILSQQHTVVDQYTGITWTHNRNPLPALSISARYTLFGTPKPLDVGVTAIVSTPQIREQSITHQERTFYNWGHLSSKINALMISDDANTLRWAASFGLQVSPSMEYEPTLKVPTYRGLFKEALKVTRSEVVGMGNADLLFADDLAHTLDAVMEYAANNNFKRVFVTGRRTNAEMPSMTQFSSPEEMHAMVKNVSKCGSQFITMSEDYFFVTRDFWNWDKVPELVLGGVAFDNWIVNRIQSMSDVLNVDATNTVTCVHQEHPNFSHSANNPRSDFNLRLAKNKGTK